MTCSLLTRQLRLEECPAFAALHTAPFKNEGIRATRQANSGKPLYAVSALPKSLPRFKFPAFSGKTTFGPLHSQTLATGKLGPEIAEERDKSFGAGGNPRHQTAQIANCL